MGSPVNEEASQNFSQLKSELRSLQEAINSGYNDWNHHVTTARALLQRLDANSIMRGSHRSSEQIAIVKALQRLAYHDPDSGGVRDLAQWCMSQWLRLLQYDGNNVEVLQGLGHAWMYRAQAILARIHRDEGSSSSGTSGSRPGTGQNIQYTASDDAQDAARAIADADFRTSTADYVEARGILLPSTEYFSRAISIADQRSQISGNLLSSAAEAYMNLGNVSHSSINEQHFRQALQYLRRASHLPNYTLSQYLQNYLDDYGRLID